MALLDALDVNLLMVMTLTLMVKRMVLTVAKKEVPDRLMAFRLRSLPLRLVPMAYGLIGGRHGAWQVRQSRCLKMVLLQCFRDPSGSTVVHSASLLVRNA